MKFANRLIKTGLVCAALGVTFLPKASFAEEVYMIRGFMNVWSKGMDQMTAKLKKRGVNAKVYSNGAWNGLADSIIKRSKQGKVSYPIIIAGHSVGGQEAPRFANKLAKAGVKVSLVIGIDPGFAEPPKFTHGSAQVVNYWVGGSDRGNPYKKAASFKGSLRNVDIRAFSKADHVQIDKDPKVQAKIISLIMSKI